MAARDATELTQELPALIQAKDAGFISTDAVSQSYFGTSAFDVARDEARYQATQRALGFSPRPTPTPVAEDMEEHEVPAKKDAKPGDEAAEAAPAAPASTPAPSGKAPVPTWDPANSPLTAKMLAEAEEVDGAARDATSG